MLEFLHSSLKNENKKNHTIFLGHLCWPLLCFVFFCIGEAAWLEQPSPVKPRQRRGERKERTAVLRKEKGGTGEVVRTMSSWQRSKTLEGKIQGNWNAKLPLINFCQFWNNSFSFFFFFIQSDRDCDTLLRFSKAENKSVRPPAVQ